MSSSSDTSDHHFRAEPLRWSEGMLLSPQHFQQNDIYWHEQLALRLRWTRSYAWGLWDFELDELALRQGVVQLRRIEAILQDGLAVQFPASQGDKNLAALKVADHPALSSLGGKLRVHLAVPKRLSGAASARADMCRFQTVFGATVADENTGADKIEIERLRASLSLLPVDKLSAGHEHFPLLEIERVGNEFQLTNYHPPLLRVKAADFLQKRSVSTRLKTLLSAVHAKAASQAADAEGQRLVAALTAALPPLQVMEQSGEVHPFDLYLALSGLLGQVAQIAPLPLSTMLVLPYKHDEFEFGFEGLLSSLTALLDRVRTGYRVEAFERIEAGVFEITLDKGWQLDELHIEARGSDRERLTSWIHDAHIGDDALQKELVRRRLPGAGRRATRDTLARRLPIAEDALVFTLENGVQADKDGKLLPFIREGGRLRVVGGETAEPEGLRLYFRQPPAAA